MPHSNRIHIINAVDLMEKEIIVPEYIMDPLITKLEKVVLSAEPKSGKSTMIMQMVESLINGTSFFGFKPTKPCRVLYINAEIPEWRIHERIKLTKFKYNGNLFINIIPNFYNINEKRNIFSKKEKVYDIDILRKEIEKVQPVDVLVLDPMINFYVGNENDTEQMRLFCAVVDQLILDYNIAVVMAHHERKRTELDVHGRPFEKMRGSTVLRGWYTLGMSMGTKTDDVRDLYFDCRNTDKDIDKKFIYNILTKRYAELTPEQGGEEIVKTALAQCMQPMTASDLETYIRENFSEETRKRFLSTSRNNVLETIRTMQNKQILTKIGTKLYITEIVNQAQKDK